MKKAALYARVSTTDQNVRMQIHTLREHCRSRGVEIHREYTDQGISGTKGSRPALNQLMEDAKKRKFDAVIVYRFDRFARSVRHLIQALDEFKALGIDFISHQENIDTASPLGKAIFVIVGAMTELERNIIVERVKSGLNAARSRGTNLGRPKVFVDLKKVLKLKKQGVGMNVIAKQLKVSRSTLYRLISKK